MLGLHHLALGAHDVDKVAAFYRDCFGLPEIARHFSDDGGLRSVWLDIGSAVLMIERSGEPLRRVEGVGAGPFLLAFRVTSAERAALERTLGLIEARSEHTSYARDPEGNRIAISAYHFDRQEAFTQSKP